MLKVFLAEDESLVRETIRDSIPWEAHGYTFVGDAMDGETALPLLLAAKPDLLITDIRMPFMDGLELTRRVREFLPDTRVMILSGYDSFDYARRAIDLQVTQYLLKPFLKDDLLKALDAIREQIEEDRKKDEPERERREYEEYFDTTREDGADLLDADPMIIRSFVRSRSAAEIPAFVDQYLDRLGEGCRSMLFRKYLVVSLRVNAAAAVQEMDLPQEVFQARIPQIAAVMDEDSLRSYMSRMLQVVIELRDESAQNRSGDTVNLAIAYIDEHFTEEDISLNSVAKAINISPNHLSAAFSQRTGVQFVEYITQKRMEKARELLRQTSLRSGEVGALVGYRDPHYFSTVFRKAHGCTPRDYRSGGSQT